jgi:hypothetical protein
MKMMSTISDLAPLFVTDADGKKTAVILPIEKYTELIEDLQDLAVIAERRDEPSLSHAQVVAELKKDDYL